MPTRLEIPVTGQVVIHILSANEDREAVGESITPALVAFRVEQGEAKPGIYDKCEQETETRTSHVDRDGQGFDFTYPAVVVNCSGGIKLVVVGIDLTVKK